MRAAIQWAVFGVAITCFACRSLAQEVVPAPEPNAEAKAGDQTHSAPAANAATDQDANRWRYRFTNGRWWYWTPQNRWMWYSDEGKWIDYVPAPTPPAIEPTYPLPEYGGYYPYHAYHPGYGYRGGYYPGVVVETWPYGNVGVAVGRRVAVGVAGPRGAVRVGRIYVGW